MLKAIWFLVKISLLVAAVAWLAERPGTIEVEWLGYGIRTSAGFVIAAFLSFLLVYTAGWHIWRAFVSVPAALSRYRDMKQREQGYRDVTSGLVAVAAGDARAAEKYARRAQKLVPGAPLAKLLSAQTHLLRGDAARARAEFSALLDDDAAAFFGVKGLLQASLKSGDIREALQYIRRADDLQPRRKWVIHALFDLETRNREWARAHGALDKGERQGVFTPSQARRHRQALWLAESEAAAKSGADGALRLASKAFGLDAGFTPAALRLARLKIQAGKRKDALRALEKSWAGNPHPAIAEMWMREKPAPKKILSIHDEDSAVLAWAKKLAAINPRNREAARLLGAAAMEAKQYREAREALTRAADYRLLAKLEHLDGGDEARARQWLEAAADMPPEAKWVCHDCGHAADGWTPLCRRCGVFNAAEWRMPDSAARALPQAMPLLEADVLTSPT